MAGLSSLNDYINRINNGYQIQRHFSVQQDASIGNNLISGQGGASGISPIIYSGETLPSGVTGYRLTNAFVFCSLTGTQISLVQLISLGTFNLDTATFTAGSSMPTVTEGGVSRATDSAILMAVTSGTISSTSGVMTITYTNQDGTTGKVTPNITIVSGGGVGTSGFVTLATGDISARAVTNAAKVSGTLTGATLTFYGVIPLGNFSPDKGTNQAQNINFLTDMFPPPLIDAGDNLYLLYYNTNGKRFIGGLTFVGEQA